MQYDKGQMEHVCRMDLARGHQLGTREAQETEEHPREARDSVPGRVWLETTRGSLGQGRAVAGG